MQIPLPDFLHPVTAGAPVYCGTASGGGTPGRSLVLERGFHFVLCTGGSALVVEGADTAARKVAELPHAAESRDTDEPNMPTPGNTDKGHRNEMGDKGGAAGSKPRKGERRLQQGDLLLLSPSRTATLRLDGAHDTLECICIDPYYFDTLPDGQPLYNQLSGYLGDDRLPVVRLDGTQYGALRLTASLFPAHRPGAGSTTKPSSATSAASSCSRRPGCSIATGPTPRHSSSGPTKFSAASSVWPSRTTARPTTSPSTPDGSTSRPPTSRGL